MSYQKQQNQNANAAPNQMQQPVINHQLEEMLTKLKMKV